MLPKKCQGEKRESRPSHGARNKPRPGRRGIVISSVRPGNTGLVQGFVMEIASVQKSLATKALYQPKHRFDDLYRHVRDVNWLESARSTIMSNNGAKTPGVDGINGQELPVSEWLTILNQTIEELREGTYKPMPARRIYIPKANGKLRPLGIPTIRDRMVQQALKMVMEPIYESHFLPCSNGFRPGRSTISQEANCR